MWAEMARYIQHVTGGDVTREPLQVYANIAQIAGTILAIVALVLAITGVIIASNALCTANTSLQEDRQERRTIRQERQQTLWTALRLDVGITQEIARADLERFARQPDPQDPFVWTPLPVDTVAQALYEAALLGLGRAEDIGALQDLRNQIVRANANIRAYFVMSWVGATGAAGRGVSQLTRAQNERLQQQFRNIVTASQNMTTRFQERWG